MTKFNLDKLREVAEPRKEKPDFMEKNKVNAIDYWYKKYMALKETERIPKPELTWEDIKTIVETADMMVSEVNRSSQELIQKYPTEKAYYTEVLNRFNKSKEKK